MHQALSEDLVLHGQLASLAAWCLDALKSAGKLTAVCPCLRVASSRTEGIQEGHILLGHILCAQVESAYFERQDS